MAQFFEEEDQLLKEEVFAEEADRLYAKAAAFLEEAVAITNKVDVTKVPFFKIRYEHLMAMHRVHMEMWNVFKKELNEMAILRQELSELEWVA